MAKVKLSFFYLKNKPGDVIEVPDHMVSQFEARGVGKRVTEQEQNPEKEITKRKAPKSLPAETAE